MNAWWVFFPPGIYIYKVDLKIKTGKNDGI